MGSGKITYTVEGERHRSRRRAAVSSGLAQSLPRVSCLANFLFRRLVGRIGIGRYLVWPCCMRGPREPACLPCRGCRGTGWRTACLLVGAVLVRQEIKRAKHKILIKKNGFEVCIPCSPNPPLRIGPFPRGQKARWPVGRWSTRLGRPYRVQ